MKNSGTVFLLFFINVYCVAFSQTNSILFSVSPTFGATTLHFADSAFTANDSTNLQITEVKFYISEIQFLKNGVIVLEEKTVFI